MMTKRIFKYLKNYDTQPVRIDRLIISTFLKINSLRNVNNGLIEDYLIDINDIEYIQVEEFSELILRENLKFDFEDLIQLFEFVISPSDRIVNGAVYTPLFIREQIINQCIISYNNNLDHVKAADLACGCGGFLLSMAKQIHEQTGRSYYSIYSENIYGVDIAEYSIQRSKILLTLFAYLEGEIDVDFVFNLFVGDSLIFNWNEVCPEVLANEGFDIIVGNPPYVCSRNMDAATLELLKQWEVASTGHPDLYIPFFQIGIENINRNGILGYITVNTFIKSINGRALRSYFSEHNINLKIINFGGEQIFPDRNTYTCICYIKHGNGRVEYTRAESSEIESLNLNHLNIFNYDELNHFDGWNLVNDSEIVEFLDTIERTGIKFKELFNTKNGIATLKNDVFKFKPIKSDRQFYYLDDNGVTYPIEISICRDIVNANRLKEVQDIDRLKEKVIFPYDKDTKIFPENVMKKEFPKALKYLESKRKILATRDKGNRLYEAWYAYGRRQSMDINAYKLFFPHICERPVFVICEEQDLLFYNGMAIVSKDLKELQVIKKIMESDLFYFYIKNTTKDYSSGYISMSRNYLKNFGVYQFSPIQEIDFLNSENPNLFLEELYKVGNIFHREELEI